MTKRPQILLRRHPRIEDGVELRQATGVERASECSDLGHVDGSHDGSHVSARDSLSSVLDRNLVAEDGECVVLERLEFRAIERGVSRCQLFVPGCREGEEDVTF